MPICQGIEKSICAFSCTTYMPFCANNNWTTPFLWWNRCPTRHSTEVKKRRMTNPNKLLPSSGKLMNVGFVEASRLYGWHCFVFHDVDLLPEDDRNLYTCPQQPRHMSVAVDKFNYKCAFNQDFFQNFLPL
jgi:hypothetical protein